MRNIFGYHALRIGESELCHAERNAVFVLVFLILLRIPLEPGLCDERRLAYIWVKSHIIVWSPGYGYGDLQRVISAARGGRSPERVGCSETLGRSAPTGVSAPVTRPTWMLPLSLVQGLTLIPNRIRPCHAQSRFPGARRYKRPHKPERCLAFRRPLLR